MKYILLFLTIFIVGCSSLPKEVTPKENFSLEKYLGTWYEIARLDHSFERGLSNVTANYSIREDGKVRVVNRGYKEKGEKWKIAEGKAMPKGRTDIGHLKVSFFGPFYGSYIVLDVDDSYSYALVTGSSKKYLWILSREKTLNPLIKEKLIKKAKDLGYPVDQLIFVDQSKN